MQKGTCQKRLQATVDTWYSCMGENNERASWNKLGCVVEEVWKDIGGNQEETMPIEKFGRHKIEVGERIERRERLALRKR